MFVNMRMPEVDVGKLGSSGEEGLWPAELPASHVASSRVPAL